MQLVKSIEYLSSSYILQRKRLFESFAACTNDSDFNILAQEIFRFQEEFNPVFNKYNAYVRSNLDQGSFSFLPISFFKTDIIKTGEWEHEQIYTSSGTTSMERSSHFVSDKRHYLDHTKRIYKHYYGSLEDYCFLCLLPSYLEREGSSLIDMCAHFIDHSQYDESDFYLYNHDQLYETIAKMSGNNIPTVLIGVSYALLDFADSHKIEESNNLVVMKTGGMKGRRKEMNSEELDTILKEAFSVDQIHAEYGMTECLSQLYSKDGKSYQMHPWMKVIITDLTDPFKELEHGKTGRINIIDLANIDSCSFIATDDIGYTVDNSLYIQGRIDNSDLRGCNMLL